MKLKTWVWLSLAVLLQFFILVGMYVKAALPIWTGQEIRVKTIPVDPRSLFRGNYARLQYRFSQLNRDQFYPEKRLRQGEILYVSLKPGKDDLYAFSSASLEKPDSGIFLRARVKRHRYSQKSSHIRLKYGIEAFFAPKEKALQLERELQKSGVAVLRVADSGRARIIEVIGQSN